MPLYLDHRSVPDRWMCANHQNSSRTVRFVSDPGMCRCAHNLSTVLVKIVVFRTHRRNLLASTMHKFAKSWTWLGQGGVLENQPSKWQFPCTFCQWIEPYSLGEAAFCPYFRSSSTPSQWSPIGNHSNAIIFGPSLGARQVKVRQPSKWKSYCPFCLWIQACVVVHAICRSF